MVIEEDDETLKNGGINGNGWGIEIEEPHA